MNDLNTFWKILIYFKERIISYEEELNLENKGWVLGKEDKAQ